jgi:tetratricopeptide (TPR) repeat protein
MILVLMSSSIAGASNQEIFLRGNKAYQEGDYNDALDWYEQIEEKGNAVWHNMGNCCYHLQRSVDACVYWQRAQQHAACDDYCALNTQIALLDVEVVPEKTSVLQAWILWLRSHTASYSLMILQLITLIFWFAVCIALRREMHWSIAVILLIISIFLIWMSIDLQLQRNRSYAVTNEEICVFVGPNSSYHQQGIIKQAQPVIITGEREGWYKIAYKGLAGWVQADKLVKV